MDLHRGSDDGISYPILIHCPPPPLILRLSSFFGTTRIMAKCVEFAR